MGAPKRLEPKKLIGRKLAERYEIERLVGSGGMGSVFAATDPDGRRVAVKVLSHEAAPTQVLERFLRESRLKLPKDTPHVVPILDAGQDESTELPFLVMPLLQGTDVSRLVGKLGALDARTAVRIARQACLGLQTLHEIGIVHRDVKPSNLFLHRVTEHELSVRICDFGIAKQLDVTSDGLTRTGFALGSPQYMAPEQVEDSRTVDERSDVWSLGASMYRVLCGKAPFADIKGTAKVLARVMTGDVPSIRERAPWLDVGLTDVLHKALRRNRGDRWQSARAFADALAPFTGGEDRITADMLEPMDPEVRRRALARATELETKPDYDLDLSETATSSSSSGLFSKFDEEPGAADALIGHMLGGRYEVLRLIGRGGMGAVFEVRSEDGTHRAAKLIDRRQVGEGDRTFRRFLREARAATSIEHEHLVATIEAGQDEALQTPFIIMEMLHGVDLKSLIADRAPMESAGVVRLFVQAAQGIAEAHRQGIVHRDIKPANIFLHVDEEGGPIIVKVCDFGIAKRTTEEAGQETGSHELTRTGGMIGSPMYMSPEHAMNAKTVDHRTDIWSLCVSLYEALSGVKVWAGRSSLGEIIVAICTQPVPWIRQHAPWVDRDLAEAIHRGLKSDVDQRWSSMDEVIAALEPFAMDREVTLDDLRPVSAGQLALAPSVPPPPPVADQAADSSGSSSTLGSVATLEAIPERKGRTGAIIAGSSAVVAAAVAAVVLVGRPSTRSASVAPVEPPPAPAPSHRAPTRMVVEVSVVPATAGVSVNGEHVEPSGGTITLEGEAGDSFDVVVTGDGGLETKKTVILTKDRRAEPSVVELRKPQPATQPRPAKAKGPSRHGSLPPPMSSRAPAPTKPAAPTKPKFKDEW